ncbi:MAG TPA: hypothetical protein VM778_08925 [Gemmatimonadota bacterium]|nr:hypothetical protein [Gemmatimonadota bacterium]
MVTLAFGDAPVEGLVYLLPGEDGIGAGYAVDLDEDGIADREGRLERGIGFGYRFLAPGVHRLRVTFDLPTGERRVVEPVVVVNDPSRTETLVESMVPPADPDWRSFEGIVMDPAGEHLYVAAYSGGSLVQLDPTDLSVLRRIDTIGYSIEGLTVAPSGERLFAVYKYHHLATVAIPEMVLEHRHERISPGAFFIRAVGESRVLVSGRGPLSLMDPFSGAILGQATSAGGELLYSWHFAVSEDRATAVVAGRSEAGSDRIHVVDLATMTVRREIPLPLLYTETVALDPHEPRAYVLGNDVDTGRLLVVDIETGEVLRDLALGPSYCGSYCVANPTAVAAGGRYVAMEWYGGAYVIDTELDLPVHRLGYYGFSNSGFSVTGSPTEEDVFYFLDSGGGLRKVRVR